MQSTSTRDTERAFLGEESAMPRLYVDEVEEKIISDALAKPFAEGEPPARVVTCGTRPFAMLRANSSFHTLTGLVPETSYGSSLKVLHTESTNAQVWEACMSAAAKSLDTEACILTFQLAEGISEVLRMEVTAVTAGKDMERRLLLVQLSKAPAFHSVEEVQSNVSKGARAIVRLISPQHITHVSDGWCAAFESDRKQFVGRSLKGLNGPATDQRIVQRMMKNVSRCLPAEETFVAYCLNGTMKLVNLRCYPLQRETGDVDHFCVDAMTSPILSLRTVTAEVSEEPTLVLSVDGKRTILHASDSFSEMMHLESGKLEGESLSQMLNLDLDGPVLDAAVSDVVNCTAGRKRAAPLLITLFNKDSKPVVAKVQFVPLLDAKFSVTHLKLSLSPVDVLSFPAAVAATPESRPKMITSITPDAIIKHVSEEWCTLYGYAQNEVVGQSLSLLHDTSAEPETLQEMMDKVSAGKTHEFTTTTHRRDGSSLRTTLKATPVLSDTGRLDLCMAEVLEVKEEEEEEASAREDGQGVPEYPITPTGHITHINGYTQLVLYPKADPTMELCIDYLEHLRDAAIVKGWKWDGDALRVNVDTRRVLNYTHRSPWCRTWTPNLRTWDAWWNRMLWVVGEASRRQHAKDESDLASDLDFLGGASHTMPALDDLFAASDFRQLSDDNATSTSPSNDETSSEDAADSSEPEARSCFSAPPVRPEGVSEIALRRLRESKAYTVLGQLGAALERAGLENPVCVLDAKGHLVMVNDTWLSVTGFSERHTLGLNWSYLAAPLADSGDVSRLHEALERATPGGKDVQASVLLRRQDGEAFWSSMVARPVKLEVAGEASMCFCVSLEDTSFIVEAEDDGSLEYDTYVSVAQEELALEQRDAVSVVAKTLEALCRTASAPHKAPPVHWTRAELRIEQDHEACIALLWELKKQNRVRAWSWDDTALSVEVAGVAPPELMEMAAASAHRSAEATEGAQRRCSEPPLYQRAKSWTAPVKVQVKAEPEEVKVKVEPEEVKVKAEPEEESVRVKAEAASAEEQIRALQEQVAALQLRLAQTAPTEGGSELAALQQELRTERAVNSAAISALGKSLQPIKEEAAARPQALPAREARRAESVAAKDEAFGAMSEQGQRQYLAQVEAAHAFLHEQLELDQASVWTRELIADFDAEMRRGAELHSGLCLCDDLGGVVWSNAAFVELTGFSAREVFGCQWLSFLCGPETDGDDMATLQKSLDARTPASACLFGLHEDGSPLWLQVRQEPAELVRGQGKGHKCFVLSLDDVTPIMARIMRGADDSALTVRAANVISERQQVACRVASRALRAIGIARTPAHSAAPKQSAPAVSKRAEAAPSRGGGGRATSEVLLLPGADAAEVMLSGVLWKLRSKGMVARWAWEGELSLRVWVWTDAWSLVDGAPSAMTGTWKSWWRRMHAAATVGANKAVLTQEDAVLESPEARAICSAREPWMILEINPALQRLSGFSNSEVKGRSLCMMQGMLDWPGVVRAIRAAEERVKGGLEEGAPLAATVPVKATRKDGQAVEATLSVVPVVAQDRVVDFICAEFQPC